MTTIKNSALRIWIVRVEHATRTTILPRVTDELGFIQYVTKDDRHASEG